MEIKVAEHCGFCYGVKRAVALAQKAATDRVQGATLGPLIHNPQLIAELASKGIACKDSLEQFAPGETVIFRSHGEGPETYAQAEKQGLTILDATCPNVRLAQQKAAQAAADGYFPVIVGEKNHPEVKSILKWAGKNAICVECIKDISYVPRRERYGVIIQTTFELQKFNDILQALQEQRRIESEARLDRERLGTLEKRNIVSQMSAMIAHEVKSPVAAIGNFKAILDYVLPASVREEKTVKTALVGIETEAERIAGIVNRVRNYAKSRQTAHVKCDLTAAVRQAERSLKSSSAATVPVVLQLPSAAPVLGDALELERKHPMHLVFSGNPQ